LAADSLVADSLPAEALIEAIALLFSRANSKNKQRVNHSFREDTLMEFLKELSLRLAARFLAGLVVAGLAGGLVAIVQSCQPSDEDSLNSDALEQFYIEGQ
jgi:hypothetical protein